MRTTLERITPENVFLVLACSFGLAVLVANAPFQAPDENDHFARAFQLSEGTLIGERRGASSGGELPRAAIEVTDSKGIAFHYERKMTADLFRSQMRPITLDWRRAPRAYVAFPHTVVYGPTGYLPQVMALVFGRHLRVGPLGLMYLARLAAFSASMALGYEALKILPVYRWTTLIILLCPMSLYLFGSIAPDGIVIAAATLVMAIVARIAVQKDRAVPWREQAALLVLTAALALTKPPYVTLAGVATLVVLPKLGSLRRKAFFCAAIVLGCLVPGWLWGRAAMPLFVPGRGDLPIDPVAQAHHIAAMPFTFLALVIHTIRNDYVYNYKWMVGTLGWGDTPMPSWFYPAFGFGVVGCLVLESCGAQGIRWRLRLTMIAAAAISVLLTYAALYADWNPPGSTQPIEGIEGRYFLPLLPLVVLSFPPLLARPLRLSAAVLATFMASLSAAVCLGAVVFRYYAIGPQPTPSGTSRLTRFTTRAVVGSKENILVSGFDVGGNGVETLLIQAEGPSLDRRGIKAPLSRPSISILDAYGRVLASNTGWETDSQAVRTSLAGKTAGAPVLLPGEADSAIVVSVPEGKYTVLLNGANDTAGVAQEEIYEITGNGTRLTHFSSRAYVGRGGNAMAVGFDIGGKGTEALLCRAVGPGLSPFGVLGALSQLTLSFPSSSPEEQIRINGGSDAGDDEITSATSSVGAFPLSVGTADRAAVLRCPPGIHSMDIKGEGDATGIALAEIYELP